MGEKKDVPRESSDLPRGSDDTPPDASLARELEDEGKAGKGINQAGFLKDEETPGRGQS